jgi:hypothetical protein
VATRNVADVLVKIAQKALAWKQCSLGSDEAAAARSALEDARAKGCL